MGYGARFAAHWGSLQTSVENRSQNLKSIFGRDSTTHGKNMQVQSLIIVTMKCGYSLQTDEYTYVNAGNIYGYFSMCANEEIIIVLLYKVLQSIGGTVCILQLSRRYQKNQFWEKLDPTCKYGHEI